MNIALGAVLIFILLLPPIAFYFSYSFGKFAKAGPKFTLLDGLLASAIFSLFIHTLAIFVFGKEIRFDILLKLLGGEIKDLETKVSNAVFTNALKQFAVYNAIIFTIAIAFGRLTRYAVQRWNIHHKHELLRQKNNWWYLFNGYYLSEMGYSHYEFDALYIDAVVDTSSEVVIYSGYLVDFVCEGEELNRIYLGDTSKRAFRINNVKGQTDTTESFSVAGNLFCIEYSQIKNLNLRFVVFEESVADIEALPEAATE